MPYILCDSSGTMTLGAAGAVHDGTNLTNASLSRDTQISRAKAMGDTHPQKDVTSREYRGQGEVLLATGDTTGFFAAGDETTAIYRTQLGTKLFEGAVIITNVSDRQAEGDYERQTITWESTGTPTVG